MIISLLLHLHGQHISSGKTKCVQAYPSNLTMTIDDEGGGEVHQKMTDDGDRIQNQVKNKRMIYNVQCKATTCRMNLFSDVLTHFNPIILYFIDNLHFFMMMMQ